MRRREFILGSIALMGVGVHAAIGERFGRGLLWRVARADVPASHVYGTIHVPDPRLTELPAVVRQRFDAATSLMLEFVPDPYSRSRFLEAAMFLDRQTLAEKIGAEDFERAVEQLAPIGLPRELVNKLKPWGVLLNLRNPRHAEQGAPLDSQLLELARARRLPRHQIEGVEEQIFTFDEFPMESQIALLKHSLAHRDELLELAERTMEAYLERDLAAIW
ncbi:MAG TPA: TraB/GumN family protein, partial [Burkholderiales bacterium]|nr:TraB/GumN family protein [Burkholderiales bacterium]